MQNRFRDAVSGDVAKLFHGTVITVAALIKFMNYDRKFNKKYVKENGKKQNNIWMNMKR